MNPPCDRCGSPSPPRASVPGKVSSCATGALRSWPSGRRWPRPRRDDVGEGPPVAGNGPPRGATTPVEGKAIETAGLL